MPTRRAVIIGNNVGYGASNRLPGVTHDLIGYRDYLTSAAGGEWRINEISILSNYGTRDIKSVIRSFNTDYSFVVFSGHGFIDSRDNLTYACASNGYVSEDELYTSSDRQTLILDCCRQVSSASESFLGSDTRAYEFGDAVSDSARPKTYRMAGPSTPRLIRRIINPRQKFDLALEASSFGKFTGYSCLVDETSGDNPQNGGVFSSALIKSGITFGSSNNLMRNYFTIRQAMQAAMALIDADPFTTQTPAFFENPSMQRTHPFAVTNRVGV